jgi:hypothetical protein
LKKTFKNIFVALALTGAGLTGVMTGAGNAYADSVGISINLGDVAVGFSDGYWDHDHHWHHWRNSRYREAYRHAHGAEYHGSRHTHFANGGWHDHDDHRDDHRDHRDDYHYNH